MTDFVRSGGIVQVKSAATITQKMAYPDFLKRLRDQRVCTLSLHNATRWHQEVPANLMEAYLNNRNHHSVGALLHEDALAYARAGIRVQ